MPLASLPRLSVPNATASDGEDFVDEKPSQGGVPRTQEAFWDDELTRLRVSYTGEMVEKAKADPESDFAGVTHS